MSTMIFNGRVVGTWKRVFNQKAVVLTMEPFTALKKGERQAFAAPAERYGEFIGRPVIVSGQRLATSRSRCMSLLSAMCFLLGLSRRLGSDGGMNSVSRRNCSA
jgi:Winged helix DNA-binding domain